MLILWDNLNVIFSFSDDFLSFLWRDVLIMESRSPGARGCLGIPNPQIFPVSGHSFWTTKHHGHGSHAQFLPQISALSVTFNSTARGGRWFQLFLRLNQQNLKEGKGEWRALLPWQSSLGCTPHILLRAPLHTNHEAPALHSFSFCLFFFFQSAFWEHSSHGACPGVCQAWSCQNHVPIHLMEESQEGDLQSQSAGNSSRMAGDKSHLRIPGSRILFRWQLPVLPGDEMEKSVWCTSPFPVALPCFSWELLPLLVWQPLCSPWSSDPQDSDGIRAATTIAQLLLKPCTDFLPSPLGDGGKGELLVWFLGCIFLWQHPRVPWVCPRCDTHLGQPEQHLQVRRMMVASPWNIHTGWVFHLHRWQCCVPSSWRIYWFLV